MNSELRVALVTGSTSGIGLALAHGFAEAGYTVVVHSRSSVETGEKLAAALPAALYIQADLAVEADRARLIAQILAHYGRLDVLVNNAGISRVIPHGDLSAASPEIWHELYEVNVVAPFRLIALAQEALKNSAQSGTPGCVINISSHAGVRPKGASIPYATTKAALNHMTKLLALSLAPDIRVNAIAPGLVDTPLTADWADAHMLWQTRSPMRRAAKPADIAQLATMLAANQYVTGEILTADGGLNLT